jgi:dihydrofolate reductase
VRLQHLYAVAGTTFHEMSPGFSYLIPPWARSHPAGSDVGVVEVRSCDGRQTTVTAPAGADGGRLLLVAPRLRPGHAPEEWPCKIAIRGDVMAVVVMHAVASVDGYIADADDEVGPLFEWYFNGDVDIVDGGRFKVSKASADYVRPMWQSIATSVIGRHLFDLTNGWDGTPPAGEHLVVVSRRPKPDGWHPEASCHFFDDVAAGIAKAKELAGPHVVAVAAGEVGGQALALGLVDEVAMDVVPVVFGSGKRYFGPVDRQHLLEDPDVVIRGDRVLHLRYRVRR